MSTQGDKLKAIADAIREVDGTDEPIVANDFPDRIRSISPGVKSFNGRTGDVVPAAGDYNAAQVGAVSMQEVTSLLNRATAVNIANTNYSTIMARGIYAGTTDMTAGSSSLTSGVIYLVYE